MRHGGGGRYGRGSFSLEGKKLTLLVAAGTQPLRGRGGRHKR